MQLKGIAKGLQIEGEGHVMWAMHNTDEMLWLIKIPAFLCTKMQGQATEHDESVANVQRWEDWNQWNQAYSKWHPIWTYQGHCHCTSQPNEQPSNLSVLLLWGYHQGNGCPHYRHIYSGWSKLKPHQAREGAHLLALSFGPHWLSEGSISHEDGCAKPESKELQAAHSSL